jgi:hypothetical protein
MKLALSLARITHNLFIPHSRNNYKAGLAHPGGLISLGIFLMVFQLSMQLLIQTPGAPKVLGYAANIYVE